MLYLYNKGHIPERQYLITVFHYFIIQDQISLCNNDLASSKEGKLEQITFDMTLMRIKINHEKNIKYDTLTVLFIVHYCVKVS